MKSNRILSLSLLLSIILVISVYFLYRPNSWPAGPEALGCLSSVILMTAGLMILWIFRDKIINDLQKRNVALGLAFGLLWTIEISINNLIRPGLPLRDNIDNIFWATIAILILIAAIRDAYQTNKFLNGMKSGFWTGVASGAIACLSTLIIIVFGMKYILMDPLNIKEWNDIKATENSPGMNVYFAYQSFAGAIMHLFILGALMGLFLGIIGGFIGLTLIRAGRNRNRDIIKLLIIIFISGHFFFCSCSRTPEEKISFPYSQWTIGKAGSDIAWEYDGDFKHNESFIAKPADSNWEEWYKSILKYRDLVRKKIGKEEPILRWKFPSKNNSAIHFNKYGYSLKIMPSEHISIQGSIKNSIANVRIYFDYDLKSKGEETSSVVRRKLIATDSIELKPGNEWITFRKNITVPHFSTDSFSISPIVRLNCIGINSEGSIDLKDIHLSIDSTDDRVKLLTKIENYIKQQSENNTLEIPPELACSHQNFVMGFVFMWDQDFWDPVKGRYTVDAFCDKMEHEFGGFQSVILWHSYPNIGIDEKNQFDFFNQMPGGLGGIRKVVDDFHRHDIKVFITYNPWDLDTRRPPMNDNKELAQIIDGCNADGIFLDTWSSSTGHISIFSVEKSIREEVAKFNRKVALTAELLPEFKDLIGTNALTNSWGQEIEPFNYTDLSHQKWIMPEHKQYFIERLATNRKPILAHAWINGQGIQVWENIFGTMNKWNAADRQALRKMNAIWKTYGNVYISDNWKPFVPTGYQGVFASKWIAKDISIWNIVDSANTVKSIKIEVPEGNTYYDLWNGKELPRKEENGKSFVELNIINFSCILETKVQSEKLSELLRIQQRENLRTIPVPEQDAYLKELSIKLPVKFNYILNRSSDFQTSTLKINGGEFTFKCKHIWREGGCYPDFNAKNNHDLLLTFEDDAQRIIHEHTEQLSDFFIMPKVVTNGEFEHFLKEAKYKPRYPENFLKHWNGNDCPAEIKDKPVVYVSLEDARRFAEWAGMKLPTEWQWQLAAEQSGDKFIYNEVFEWNESERNDGHNRFVNLRGGCSDWLLPSSWWYLPSAPYAQIAGGNQKFDSHVKYFLMYQGIDRASTIGFRCIKR